jgi:hypothetical protein
MYGMDYHMSIVSQGRRGSPGVIPVGRELPVGDLERCSAQTERRLLAVMLADQSKLARLTYEATDCYKHASRMMDQLHGSNRLVRQAILLRHAEVLHSKDASNTGRDSSLIKTTPVYIAVFSKGQVDCNSFQKEII